MDWTIEPLGPEHAAAAASLHQAGQPGTMLTRLGRTFLTSLYKQMAQSRRCIGYVAMLDGHAPVGVVVGTGDTGAVFRELLVRRGPRLLGPAAMAVMRDPALIPAVLETLRYPGKVSSTPDAVVAELFYIGVSPEVRRRGIGAALFAALAAALTQLGVKRLGLVVDEENVHGRSFYARQGMTPHAQCDMHGRTMLWYEMSLKGIRTSESGRAPAR